MSTDTKQRAIFAVIAAAIFALMACSCADTRGCLPTWGFGNPYPAGTNVITDAEGNPHRPPPEILP